VLSGSVFVFSGIVCVLSGSVVCCLVDLCFVS